MKPILQGIATWSWFSEEKQINFNGHLLDVGEHRILVDPPPLSDADLSNLTNAVRSITFCSPTGIMSVKAPRTKTL